MTSPTPLDPGLHCIDLNFKGLPGVIASYLLADGDDLALVETGPTTTLPALLAGLETLGVDPNAITKLLVTHIHLDHAGAAGVWMARFPRAQLFVHSVGAPHMADPSKLLVSAGRIYGDRMESLWGTVLPVPAERMTVLDDGDTISAGGRTLQAIYTPGHASHHVAYFDAERGDCFTGDVAGVRLQTFATIRPPTPPPDIDLERWNASIDRIEALQPKRILLTHYGPFDDPEAHLQTLRERLSTWSGVVEQDIAAGADRDRVQADLHAFADRDIAESDDPTARERYELATPTFMSADGLIRYFTKRR